MNISSEKFTCPRSNTSGAQLPAITGSDTNFAEYLQAAKQCPDSLTRSRMTALGEAVSRLHFTTCIKNRFLERAEKDKERALDRLKKVYNIGGQTLGETLQAITEKIDSAKPVCSLSPQRLFSCEDRLMTYTQADIVQPLNRDKERFEEAIFYFDSSPAETAKIFFKDRGSGSRPKYGALAFDEKNGDARGVGDVALYLREKTKEYMTFTACDSAALGKTFNNDADKIRSATGVVGNSYPLITYTGNDQLDFLAKDGKPHSHHFFQWQLYGAIVYKEDIDYLNFNEKIDKRQHNDAVLFANKHNILIGYN
ncbi:hypothetical protein ABK905_13945 [Acerihabitans sp. KWT182]|uniref:Uncharacterized protein n=1 Tax=Acerihabitans sp. KWT182 TaxID=3157919 RepID=A0AAU7Q4B8_9GAMM